MDRLLPSLLTDRYQWLLLALAAVLFTCAMGFLRKSMRRATAAKLPESLSLKGASFYDAVDSISNVKAGTRNGFEYVLFDHDAARDTQSYDQTVLAIKTEYPVSAITNLSRASGLHFERVGEWVFVFEPHRPVEISKRGQFVDDCFNLLEYSRGVSDSR